MAKTLFIIEAIVAVIAGIVTMISDSDMILAGLAIIILCPLLAWISSWTLYGFGELVDKTCAIERNTRSNNQ